MRIVEWEKKGNGKGIVWGLSKEEVEERDERVV